MMSEAKNAGTALYVTGLSSRVTGRELEEHFSKEGKRLLTDLMVEDLGGIYALGSR
ncbi:hypothetical protein JHK82_030399 [Glycine max]|nr:hypothetical protein JHK82_030399 [Glycine max]